MYFSFSGVIAMGVVVSLCAVPGDVYGELHVGSHAEFLLRPVLDQSALPAETVTFWTTDPDEMGFNRIIQDVSVPTITVYRSDHSLHRDAGVVVCPGGGYQAVVIDREGHTIARWLSRQGITAAVLKYRLPDSTTHREGLPASQQDALEALRFMHRHAEEWGISKDRIGIMGFSAGGHLAGSTAVFGDQEDGSMPAFAALLYPVVAMDGSYVHQGSREQLIGSVPVPGRVAEFSLERSVRKGMPPYFIFHAKNDPVVPVENSEMLADALRAKDVPADLFLSETGGHGFSLGRDPDSSRWPDLFLFWLDRLL